MSAIKRTRMRRLVALLAVALLASACTPAQTQAFFAENYSIRLERSEAVKIARQVRATPCGANLAERLGYEPTKTMKRCTEVEAAARHYFGDNFQEALTVGWCESNHNNAAVGAAGERGWLQVMPQWSTAWGWPDDPGKPLIPAMGYTHAQLSVDTWAATHVAYEIWRHQGWGPWTCKKALR